MNMLVFWAAVTGLCLIVELATYGLASIWFAIGALCALLACALGAPLWLQILCFVLVSLFTLALTRPLAKKYINSRAQPTNADRVLGTRAAVKEDIDNLAETGAVLAGGKLWSARSESGDRISAGTPVLVREIRGVKLIVSPDAEEMEAKEKITINAAE